MAYDTLNTVQMKLTELQHQLDIIMAIDHIRDSMPEPTTMLTAIVNLLADQLKTDLCLLSLIDEESGDMALKVMNQQLSKASLDKILLRELAEQTLQLDQVAIWEAQAVLSIEARGHLPPNTQIVAVPIIIGTDECLGTMLLTRSEAPFTQEEANLLSVAEDQIDSAIIQCRTYYELQQRVKELEAIYRIDQIRDQATTFDGMLNTILQEIQSTLEADMGFIMLYDPSGQRLAVRAATDADLFQPSPLSRLIDEAAQESLMQVKLICHNDLKEGLQAVMCLPLILNQQIIGVIGVANHYQATRFNIADQSLLNAIGSQIDTAIFESLEKRQLREVLGRSVGPQIMEQLLMAKDTTHLKGKRATMTVLYVDIRGSTQLAEDTDPESLVEFINHYLGRMTEVILDYEGTLDKFVGDEVMALFGAPMPQVDHALRAVRVGLALQQAHQEVLKIWHARKVMAGPIGVGIATGDLIVGEMGSSQRSDYTVIGRAANLGARICSAAQGGQVLISQATYDLVRERVIVKPIRGMQFKGVSGLITVYKVQRLQ